MATQELSIFRSSGQPVPSIIVDVVVSENHTAENEITKIPIEDGSPLSDHVIIQPDVIEISCIVGNYDGSVSSILGNLTGGLLGGSMGERAKTAWQQFKNLRNKRELLTITTQHELYENMVIALVGCEHIQGFTGAIRLTAKFQKIDISTLEQGDILEDILAGGDNDYTGTGVDIYKTASSNIDAGDLNSIISTDNPGFFKTMSLRVLSSMVTGAELDTVLLNSFTESFEMIPFTSDGSRSFFVNLVKGEARKYFFRSYYNHTNESWNLDIHNANNEPIVLGRVLAANENILQGLIGEVEDIGNLRVLDIAGTQVRGPGSLGHDTDSEAVVILFPPGVYEEIFERLIDGIPRPLNFDFDLLGYTIS